MEAWQKASGAIIKMSAANRDAYFKKFPERKGWFEKNHPEHFGGKSATQASKDVGQSNRMAAIKAAADKRTINKSSARVQSMAQNSKAFGGSRAGGDLTSYGGIANYIRAGGMLRGGRLGEDVVNEGQVEKALKEYGKYLQNKGYKKDSPELHAELQSYFRSPKMDAIRAGEAKKKAMKKEDVEQIDELKKSTLQSYANKADMDHHYHNGKAFGAYKGAIEHFRDANSFSSMRDSLLKHAEDASKRGDDAVRKSGKRLSGIAKAYSKIAAKKFTKEETINELKKSTLGSYVDKAYRDKKVSQTLAATHHRAAINNLDSAQGHAKAGFDGFAADNVNAAVYNSNKAIKHSLKAGRRERGILTAARKLAKEEVVNEDLHTAAHELALYADNDSHLYHNSHEPIIANLAKKVAKGTYDHEKAKKLWQYHADRAAHKYAQEHGDGVTPWHKMFSVADRKAAAAHFADAAKEHLGLE